MESDGSNEYPQHINLVESKQMAIWLHKESNAGLQLRVCNRESAF